MASPVRRNKVAERLKKEIAGILLAELKDPRVGMVSVVNVKVSSDLRSATVFVSVLGEKKDKVLTMKALKHARGFVQTLVAKRLDLRFAPIIRFRLDESIERAIRISALLDGIAREREADGAPAEPGDAAEEAEKTLAEDNVEPMEHLEEDQELDLGLGDDDDDEALDDDDDFDDEDMDDEDDDEFDDEEFEEEEEEEEEEEGD